jgi:predicted ATPase
MSKESEHGLSPLGEAGDVAFGPFRLVFSRRALFCDGQRICLGEPAYNVLVALVKRAGQIIDREELIANAWRTSYVEESNVRVAIAALRRAFRDAGCTRSYIETVQRKGYRFTENVHVGVASDSNVDANFPNLKIHGREEQAEAILDQLVKTRFVSIVGPGGLGKTVVATLVAQLACERGYAQTAKTLVLNDGKTRSLQERFADCLDITYGADDPATGVSSFVDSRQVVFILDGCERLVGEVAEMIEKVLSTSPNAMFVVTSREPIRACGERLFRLAPLSTPPAGSVVNAADAMSYSSVKLFAECAAANQPSFSVNDVNAHLVCEVCRCLDGWPLAIELAAFAIDSFSLEALLEVLSGPSRLGLMGRNTAIGRHRTLDASLEWSYEVLSPLEQFVYRRLSCLDEVFDFHVAQRALIDAGVSPGKVGALLASMVSKSLVTNDYDARSSFRMPATVRIYGHEKMVELGELRSRECEAGLIMATRSERFAFRPPSPAYSIQRALKVVHSSANDASRSQPGRLPVAFAGDLTVEIEKRRATREHQWLDASRDPLETDSIQKLGAVDSDTPHEKSVQV